MIKVSTLLNHGLKAKMQKGAVHERRDTEIKGNFCTSEYLQRVFLKSGHGLYFQEDEPTIFSLNCSCRLAPRLRLAA